MKRLLWFLLMTTLMLAACDTGGDGDDATATLTVITHTATRAVNQTEEPQPTSGPTSTRAPEITLPPETMIVLPSTTPRPTTLPTRTPEATNTPQPTRTSQVSSMTLVPIVETPTLDPSIQNPVITISYDALIERLNTLPTPDGTDTFVAGSYRFFFNGETLQLTFHVLSENEDEEAFNGDVRVAAVLFTQIRGEPGRLFLTFTNAYYRQNMSEIYSDPLMNDLRNHLQTALDAEILEQAQAMLGADPLFTVVDVTLGRDTIEVEIVQ